MCQSRWRRAAAIRCADRAFCEEKMADRITPRTRVWSILSNWPSTYDVFRNHGCPDMRRGVFAITARFMPLSWAARIHRVPLEKLVSELNACADRAEHK